MWLRRSESESSTVGGFHKWRYPKSWMVYDGKSIYIVHDLGVPLRLGKPPYLYFNASRLPTDRPVFPGRQRNWCRHTQWVADQDEYTSEEPSELSSRNITYWCLAGNGGMIYNDY